METIAALHFLIRLWPIWLAGGIAGTVLFYRWRAIHWKSRALAAEEDRKIAEVALSVIKSNATIDADTQRRLLLARAEEAEAKMRLESAHDAKSLAELANREFGISPGVRPVEEPKTAVPDRSTGST